MHSSEPPPDSFSPEPKPPQGRDSRRGRSELAGEPGGDSGGGGYGSYGDYSGYGGGPGFGLEGGNSIANKTFADYLNWLNRYAWIVVLTTAAGTLYGYYLFTITPTSYQSWASIQISRVKQEAAEVAERERIRLGASGELQATLEKLKMPRIYQGVAANRVFANRPEVIPKGRKYVAPWELFGRGNAGTEAESGSAAPVPEPPSAAALAGMMAGWVRTMPREGTNIVDVFATHTDPEVARDVLALLLSEFESLTAENIAGSEQYTIDYILEKSRELQEQVFVIESALARYQGCIELSQRIEAGRLAVTEMEKRYLPKWPALIEAKELLTLLHQRFSEELRSVISGSPEEEKFWEQNAPGLADLKGEELVNAQLRLVASRSSILRKGLEGEQETLSSLKLKLSEADVTRGIATKQFEIIQPPMPGAPAGPNMKDLVGRFAGGGFLFGFACVFLIGFLDPSIRTVGELERDAGSPVIGAIPRSGGVGSGEGKARELTLITERDPHAAEAVRTLRAGLTLLGDPEERRIFVVTSALPGEGKSWVSANLAVGFAQQGERTVLVDADLRKGVLHFTFKLGDDAPGLTNYLSKKASLKETVHATQVENLWFVPGGGRSANPSELLAGRNLAGFLDELSKTFDRVIIDSAPLVPVSDTLPVAKRAQSVIIVYRMGQTPRKALSRALRTLRSNQVEPVGIVANQLPRVNRRSSYGYYYGYHGGGAIDGYYGEKKSGKSRKA